MALVSAAYSDVTQQPYLAMITEGEAFRLINSEGDVPGADEAVAAMRALYGSEGLDPIAAFGLYAAAYGMTATPPAEVAGGLAEVAEAARGELSLAQGIDSGARRWALQAVANAREDMSLDSAALADGSLQDPSLGLDSAWLPGAREEFLQRAGWEPYALKDDPAALEAALAERLAADVPAPPVEAEPVPEVEPEPTSEVEE